MTDRVKRMLARYDAADIPLCIGKMRASFPVLEAMRGENIYKIRSCVHEAILTKMPISIEEDDLICGIGSSKPNGVEMDYEEGVWTRDEIAKLKEGAYSIPGDEEEEMYKYISDFREKGLGRTTNSMIGEIMADDEARWNYMQAGVLTRWKSKTGGSGGGRAQAGVGLSGFGLWCADYDVFINQGCRAIIDKAQKNLKELDLLGPDCVRQKYFLEGVIRVYKAIIAWANRYADLAERMSAEEQDPARAAELVQMSEICRRVPEYPPRTFREALQSFWFAFLLSNPSAISAAGRADQFLYPYYKADKEAGRITDAEVLELLDILHIKDMQLNSVAGAINREKHSGRAKWHNFTLGGLTRDGEDATNELTYLFFESAKEMQLPHHTITYRINEKTPIPAIVEALKVVRTGLGMPAFVSDKSYINFFVGKGVPVEDAREYCMAGCIDPVVPGITRGYNTSMFQVAVVYDMFMHNGWSPLIGKQVGPKTGDVCEMKTFEEYKEAFYKQLEYFTRMACMEKNIKVIVERDMVPDFFRSVQMRESLVQNEEYLYMKAKPYESLHAMSAVGVVNVGDSFAAVKKLVYEDKKYTMKQLMTALDANWDGFESMRKDFLNAPKFGNNDPYVDSLVAEIYDKYRELFGKLHDPNGGAVIANAISISAHQPGGMLTGATPDGRHKGDILADGSLSPAQGMDKNGPLAVMQSAMSVNADAYQAMLMNMKFHPNVLKTDEDLEKLATLLKTFMCNGGKHVQFNVVSRETLEAAQKEPEKHKDVIVRVAGYSAYFTSLTKKIQDEVKDRTTNAYI